MKLFTQSPFRWTLIVLTFVLLLAIPAAVLADNVQNDVVVGGNDIFIAGSSTTVNYRITANNGDGQTGCNAADGSAAMVTIDAPAGVTASPSSLTFSACSTPQPVSFSSSTPGNYSITVSVSDSGTGTYNTNPATFTLHVLTAPTPTPTPTPTATSTPLPPSDTTAPTASPIQTPMANGNGWNNDDVTVTWNWTDNAGGSGIDPANCTTSSTSSGEGEITLNATCKDLAGNEGSTSYIVKVDKTKPIIIGNRTPAANANGWNNGDVAVSFTCTDSGDSGIDINTVAGTTMTSEGVGQSVTNTGACTDKAGNVADSVTVSDINIDKTAPTASANTSPAANANGWDNSDVTVTFSGDDALSGIDTCDAPVVLTSEGAGQSASGTCTDKAGNVSASATASGINIDKTVPTAALVGGPADGGTYYFGFVPADPTCSASDALSGLAAPCSVSGYSNAIGSHTVSASATDNAGNSASVSATYTVLAWTLSGFYKPVDMGVLNVAKNGSTVPLKFEVFAGPTELTNTGIINTFVQQLTCGTGLATDDIENYATGGTSLRYDIIAGQFVFNWQTPKVAGNCYRVTMTTSDGSSIYAEFKLK